MATVEARTQAILQILLDGAERWDCFQFVSEQEDADAVPWAMGPHRKHLSTRQIENYIAEANRRIVEAGRQCTVDALEHHLSRRRNLYAKAVNQGDVGIALAVSRDEAALLDLYPVKGLKVSGSVTVTDPAKMTNEQLIAMYTLAGGDASKAIGGETSDDPAAPND
jgi:hypothetical protein